MVPQADEPGLQLPCMLVEGAGHENSGTQVHRVRVELVDEVVEVVE